MSNVFEFTKPVCGEVFVHKSSESQCPLEKVRDAAEKWRMDSIPSYGQDIAAADDEFESIYDSIDALNAILKRDPKRVNQYNVQHIVRCFQSMHERVSDNRKTTKGE